MKKLDFGVAKKRTPQSISDKFDKDDLSKNPAKNGFDLDLNSSFLPQPVFPDSINVAPVPPVSSLTAKFRHCTVLINEISAELENEVDGPSNEITPSLKLASPVVDDIQDDLKFKDAIGRVQQLLQTRVALREKERVEAGLILPCGCNTGGGWSSEEDEDESPQTMHDEGEKCIRCGGSKTLKRKPKIQTKKRSHKKKSQRKTPAEGKEMKKNFQQMNFNEDEVLPIIPLPDFSNFNTDSNKKKQQQQQQQQEKAEQKQKIRSSDEG